MPLWMCEEPPLVTRARLSARVAPTDTPTAAMRRWWDFLCRFDRRRLRPEPGRLRAREIQMDDGPSRYCTDRLGRLRALA